MKEENDNITAEKSQIIWIWLIISKHIFIDG